MSGKGRGRPNRKADFTVVSKSGGGKKEAKRREKRKYRRQAPKNKPKKKMTGVVVKKRGGRKKPCTIRSAKCSVLRTLSRVPEEKKQRERNGKKEGENCVRTARQFMVTETEQKKWGKRPRSGGMA